MSIYRVNVNNVFSKLGSVVKISKVIYIECGI